MLLSFPHSHNCNLLAGLRLTPWFWIDTYRSENSERGHVEFNSRVIFVSDTFQNYLVMSSRPLFHLSFRYEWKFLIRNRKTLESFQNQEVVLTLTWKILILMLDLKMNQFEVFNRMRSNFRILLEFFEQEVLPIEKNN